MSGYPQLEGRAVAPQPITLTELAKRCDAFARLLGYENSATFITPRVAAERRLSNHIIRQALTTVGVRGVFALNDGFHPSSLKPIVYLACAEDSDALAALRKRVWSQGAVPFLLVVMPDTVEVCHGFEPPGATTISVEFDPRWSNLPDALASFAADRISSSLTWSNFEIHRDSSIDNNLVDAIEALNERARVEFPEFKEDRDLINALIGKFIYVYVLVDRQILSMEWLSSRLETGAREDGVLFLQAIFSDDGQATDRWTAKAAMSVFDVVDDAINGAVFPLNRKQGPRVTNGLCHLIHRVVRRGEVLFRDGSQLGFFNVSFNVLRTETISAIYERFVSIEDADRKKHEGVFYTPPHLADHVLDRMEAVTPITDKSRLIDPAAGSGIFLVGAYRRLMERYAPADGWQPRHINLAKSLLTTTIHGVEKHPQAANVCRFSLYLTLLDYVGRASIEELMGAAGQLKFLPDLSGNIRCGDAFEAVVPSERYTHVIGNPPWPMSGGQKDRTNQGAEKRGQSQAVAEFARELKSAKLAFGHNRLSDLFTWLAVRRLAAGGATIALVLPARSLIGRSASNFAHCLARNVTVNWIGNLSHLRRKLFDGAEAPACVVVALNRSPLAEDHVSVYRPLLSSLPSGRRNEIWSLLASSVDVQNLRSRDLQKGPNGWFVQSMLGEFDRRMHEALKTWSVVHGHTLGHFLQRSSLLMSKGGSPAETGIQRTKSKERSAQLHPLSRDELLAVSADFRGWFSGNVILIPRSLNEATYHREPVAYPSTFNAVIPESQYLISLDQPISERAMPYLPMASVDGFLRYLNSGVLRYFASLFGASYLMDKARLERNDLLALPCPFVDMRDPGLLALAKLDSPDDGVLDAMNAGSDFRAAFKEFASFRKYFANAQVPIDSFQTVGGPALKVYLDRLKTELQSSFGSKCIVEVFPKRPFAWQTCVAVAFGRKPELNASDVDIGGRFLGSSIILYNQRSGTSVIVKSPTRIAWTIDQAVADAVALRREIRSSN
jgi:hypothetical protein